jgi:hypothetical protein
MGEAPSQQPVATSAAQMLEAELDRIAALGLDEVRALWREMTQQNAPKALSRHLLARMIAYRVQEQRLGKLGRGELSPLALMLSADLGGARNSGPGAIAALIR